MKPLALCCTGLQMQTFLTDWSFGVKRFRKTLGQKYSVWMSSEENQNLHFKIGNEKPWPLPASGQRAERVHGMVLQIPGRCRCRCNATLIRGWPAVEQYKLTPDKVGHLLQLAAANAGTPAKTLWFCACSFPPGSHYEPVAMRPPQPLHWWDGEPFGGEEKGRSSEHGPGI